MIYKYNIDYGTTVLELPVNSNIISTGITNNQLVVWADVDSRSYEDLEKHVINTVFTGEEAPYNSTFLGTIIHDLVYHVFVYNG